ncbi:MAG: M23 family metallopeptidase [Chloroflexi bacterium]|nr:M23 family metallopeptidase [Chloroflexota bacterium]
MGTSVSLRPMRRLVAVATAALFALFAAVSVGAQPASAPTVDPEVSAPSSPNAPRYTPDPALRLTTSAIDEIERTRRTLRTPTTFTIPVPGGVVPTAPELLPNSLRDYRGGTHEGIDFPMKTGAPVQAAATGRVSRVDYAYQEWSEPARNAALDNARRLGYTPELILDLIRGRQVWIDHGGGVVTRYAHLSAVAPLQRGDVVEPGQLIGYVGQSGYPEGGPHLHFEIRIGDTYLGAGSRDLNELRATVARAFMP